MRKYIIGLLLALTTPVLATTKGLNSIPTPDVQPKGVVTLNLVEFAPQIDNAWQFQLEYAVTKRLDIGLVHGFSPTNDNRLSMEYGAVQKKHLLLSVGFLNYSTLGVAPQPFAEGGYYAGKEQFMAGSIRVGNRNELLLGYQHTFNSWLQFSTDYQSGAANFSTAGVTFNITKDVSLNPSLFRTNDAPHHVYGSVALIYNFNIK